MFVSSVIMNQYTGVEGVDTPDHRAIVECKKLTFQTNMSRTNHNPSEALIIPISTQASERSVYFSDLRADDDTRLLRLWTGVEYVNEGIEWRALDIARGGLTVVTKFTEIEHNNTRRNTEMINAMSRSAFTLFQPDRLTDDDGNIAAVTLGRNASYQLGKLYETPFPIFVDEGVALRHTGIYVDDNDHLAIEAYDIDHLPQAEVLLTADSDTAVHTGLAQRNYVYPGVAIANATHLTEAGFSLPPLTSNIRTLTPPPTEYTSMNEIHSLTRKE